MSPSEGHHPRGSSNWQDAVETTTETTVRNRSPRSILKSLVVRQVPPEVIKHIIEQYHYLRSMPAAPRMCFGIYLDEALEGALVFTSGPRHGHRLLSGAEPQKVSVLARLWLSDILPANSESRVIGITLRLIRNKTRWKMILSYADPAAGHAGTIYQATGWTYLGQTDPSSYIEVDGTLLHARTVYRQCGSNSVAHLRATGVNAKRHHTPGKHRYAYVLDPAWRWRLRQCDRPFPRGSD